MDRHDQAIVVGQLEVGEAGDGVHLGRTDDDVTVGVAVTHDGQRLGEQVVPTLAGQPLVRLVEQFEPHRRWQFGVALGDLGPQGEKPPPMGSGVDAQLVVVVDVDDDAEVAFQRSQDHLVDSSEEPWRDVKRCASRRVV